MATIEGELSGAVARTIQTKKALEPRVNQIRIRMAALLKEYAGPRRDFVVAAMRISPNHWSSIQSAEQSIYNVLQGRGATEETLALFEQVATDWERRLPEPNQNGVAARRANGAARSEPEPPAEEDSPKLARIEERIGSIVAPLKTELDQLETEREQLEASLSAIKNGIERYRKLIKVAETGRIFDKQYKPKRSGSDPSGQVSEARVEEVFNHIKAHPLVGVPELSEALKVDKRTVSNATVILRSDNRIRIAELGKHGRRLFKVTDAAARSDNGN